MRSGFARLHPLVDLTFFVLVLAFAMFLSHPAVQLAGLVCAALFALRCTGRGFGRRMAMLLPLMLLAAVVNPLVSHQGVTVLFRFPSGNACTLESVLYGISAAVRLGTAVLWFMGWNAVMTSDKFVYLFGRILPSLSLTLSMGLRFVPRLLRRTRETADRLGVPAAALTFDTHPDTLVSGHSVPLLNTPEDRAALMREYYGIDEVLTLHFDRETMTQPWERFAEETLLGRYHAVHLVCGHDFRFGDRGAGNPEKLAGFCAQRGIGFDRIDVIELELILSDLELVQRRIDRTTKARPSRPRASALCWRPGTWQRPCAVSATRMCSPARSSPAAALAGPSAFRRRIWPCRRSCCARATASMPRWPALTAAACPPWSTSARAPPSAARM